MTNILVELSSVKGLFVYSLLNTDSTTSTLCHNPKQKEGTAARTSSATAPAFAYAVSSLLVNVEIICVEEKKINFPVQRKTECAQTLF